VPFERDILDEPARVKASAPSISVSIGMVVEDRASGFCGDVVKMTSEAVTLRDRKGNHRHFRWKPAGFLIDGKPVTLVRPATEHERGPKITASGSIASTDRTAKVAKASRIVVEGIHDAELLEHVWGDDLRDLGVVVEPIDGIDHLDAVIRLFQPGPERRLGVLVDHLVPGSKEQRLVATITDPNVLVTGHPFIDVWEAVNPKLVGLVAWPTIPRGIPWKDGICQHLGVAEPGLLWKQLRNRVRTYADLRPELVGAVEQLLDFVS
jgi:Protein of unknown function (DUF3097)